MNALPEDTPNRNTLHTIKRAALPVIFFNHQGEPEPAGAGGSAHPFSADATPFSLHAPTGEDHRLARLPFDAAANRLRRALFETGQLCVTTRDGASRLCFSGVGDPGRLLVELVPRDAAGPAADCDFPGCVGSLPQAEKLLRQIYRGADGPRLEAALSRLAEGRRRKRRAVAADLRAA